MEKEIYTIIEEVKLNSKDYNKYFDDTYILQTIIHLNLQNPKILQVQFLMKSLIYIKYLIVLQ